VEAIRQAGNPLKLVVQSLKLWAVEGFNSSLEAMESGKLSSTYTIIPTIINAPNFQMFFVNIFSSFFYFVTSFLQIFYR